MKNWYLLAYDIRETKRLKKVHRFLKKHATALQNSVFLLNVDKKTLEQIIAGVKERTKGNIDDVRLYPISNPNTIWADGKQIGVMKHLYIGKVSQTKTSGLQHLFSNLFGRN
jgi:CRISPR-associated protein Cas2